MRTVLIAGTLFILACPRAIAQAPLLLAGDNAHEARDLNLEVSLNGQRTSLIAHMREVDGHLIATGKDLNGLGIATERLGMADSADVRLDDIAGLRYHYDTAH